jgi:sodium/potassium-transporting ATPase subunit alpha
MFATECAVGSKTMTPDEAHKSMVEGSNNSVSQLRSLAGLCNAGEFDAATNNLPLAERKIAGDATDQAVLRLSESFGPVHELQRMWKKTFELAFNSKNKFMIRTCALVEPEGLKLALSPPEAEAWNENDLLLTIKGAPDIIVERCSSYVGEDGLVHPFNAEMKATVENIKDTWSSQGKRVILLARKILPGHLAVHSPENNSFEAEILKQGAGELTLVGLVGIVDPPRDEIPSVVRTLRRAGIRIFMVTGDFKLTAQAIAIECGIITNPPAEIHGLSMLSRDAVGGKTISPSGSEKDMDTFEEKPAKSITLSGPELITLNDNQWNQLCEYEEIVFARTTPEQKLRIVKGMHFSSLWLKVFD